MNKNSFVKKFLRERSFTLLIVLIVITVIFQLSNNNYMSSDNIRNILNAASLSGTLAVGMGCLLILGIPDLSTGAVGCMGGLLLAITMNAGLGWFPALIVAMLFGVGAGLVNAFFVNVCRMMPFISTLAMASVWKGLGYIITDNQSISVANVAFHKIGVISVVGIPLPFVIMIVLYIVYGLMLKYTSFGRNIYMVGGNRNAARLAGININRVRTILLINCSVIATIGGSILVGRMHNATPFSVHGTEIDGIIAILLGGISFGGGSGGMLGAFFGLLLLNFFNNGLSIIGLGTYWQIVASGLLLVLALLVDYITTEVRPEISGPARPDTNL
jgi:ribose transport system permease protein